MAGLPERQSSDIYAQRISPNGALVWASDVAVCSAGGDQEKTKVVSDGAGGAIIVWQDYRSGSRYEFYAQKVDGSGTPKWTTTGMAVSTASNNPQFRFPEIVADGSGGAIIVWQDRRSGAWQIYAQRIDNTGSVQWAADGVPVSKIAASYQYVPRPVADGSGGAMYGLESPGAIVERWLQRAALAPVALRPADKLSQGTRQRLAIARGLLHDPLLVLLDEPFTALDAIGRTWLAGEIAGLRARGRAVVVSTHVEWPGPRCVDDEYELGDGRLTPVSRGAIANDGRLARVA